MLLGMDETEDEGDLEAELLALTGEVRSTTKKPAPKGHGEFLHPGLVQAHGGEGPFLTAWKNQSASSPSSFDNYILPLVQPQKGIWSFFPFMDKSDSSLAQC